MKQNVRRISFVLILSALFLFQSYSQHSPKREFRGVWIATVLNIDWPSKPGLNSDLQRKEADQLLDHFKALNFNVVILQIRPSGDAIYRSVFEPWSQYVSGKFGDAPNPFYDPLDYFIEGCHKRGMELHAWINPFRVRQNKNTSLIEGHVLNQHPEWGWDYGNKTYLDPGNPHVRKYVTDVVKDVVDRYDIDAIHFDDYFYPYPLPGLSLPDSLSFREFAGSYSQDSVAYWRRNNIDTFICNVAKEIKTLKPWVKFGVSPFGVWRNYMVDPNGSETDAGVTTYDALYADVKLWLEKGWLDYVAPQIYWHFDHPKADFKKLVAWWNRNSYGRNVYVGHGIYRLNEIHGDPAWKNPSELPRQIQYVRLGNNIKGSVWFSSNHFFKEKIGFSDQLIKTYYKHKALVPESKWIDDKKPLPPVNVRGVKVKDNDIELQWDAPFVSGNLEEPEFYVIYRCKKGTEIDQDDPKYILDVVKHSGYLIKIPFIKFRKEEYIYRISALDRVNNESDLSNPVIINQ